MAIVGLFINMYGHHRSIYRHVWPSQVSGRVRVTLCFGPFPDISPGASIASMHHTAPFTQVLLTPRPTLLMPSVNISYSECQDFLHRVLILLTPSANTSYAECQHFLCRVIILFTPSANTSYTECQHFLCRVMILLHRVPTLLIPSANTSYAE